MERGLKGAVSLRVPAVLKSLRQQGMAPKKATSPVICKTKNKKAGLSSERPAWL